MIQYVPIECSFVEGSDVYFINYIWVHGHRQGKKNFQHCGMGKALLWKPFTSDAVPPKWIRPKGEPPLEKNKVTVTAFCNGWCPAQNLAFERARTVVAEPQFADKVVFRGVDTFDRVAFLRFEIAEAPFVNIQRNDAMVTNILSWTKRLHPRTILVLCGFEHRYHLRNELRTLGTPDAFILREYWTY